MLDDAHVSSLRGPGKKTDVIFCKLLTCLKGCVLRIIVLLKQHWALLQTVITKSTQEAILYDFDIFEMVHCTFNADEVTNSTRRNAPPHHYFSSPKFHSSLNKQSLQLFSFSSPHTPTSIHIIKVKLGLIWKNYKRLFPNQPILMCTSPLKSLFFLYWIEPGLLSRYICFHSHLVKISGDSHAMGMCSKLTLSFGCR